MATHPTPELCSLGLLDENLPRKRVAALRAEGHEAESVHTLRQAGIDNGTFFLSGFG